MSTDHDTTRMVRSWLRTDEHETADRILDAVLSELDATPQRRPWWPARRIADMNLYAKLAIAATAVVAIALLGVNLLPAASGPAVGGPAASPSASTTAPPSPSPSPESRAWPRGPLAMQRYHVVGSGVSFSFELPSLRWQSSGDEVIETGVVAEEGRPADKYAWILFGGLGDVATDPCQGKSRSVNGSIEDLATALTTIPGTSAEEPVDVTVGGLPAKLVEFTIDPGPPCDIESFWLYGDTSLHPNKDTSIIRIWITEVDGQRYVFTADQSAPDAENEREIQQIIDSIQFESP